MTYTIDCSTLTTPASFHHTLQQSLHFPDYYGHNFDALLDQLRELADALEPNTPLKINFCGFSSLVQTLTTDNVTNILGVFCDWKSQYPNLSISVKFEL